MQNNQHMLNQLKTFVTHESGHLYQSKLLTII